MDEGPAIAKATANSEELNWAPGTEPLWYLEQQGRLPQPTESSPQIPVAKTSWTHPCHLSPRLVEPEHHLIFLGLALA